MNSRERFYETMRYGKPDRAPCFDEGIRKDVLKAWRREGLPRGKDLSDLFDYDRREEVWIELGPMPALKKWPTRWAELDELRKRMNPEDPERLPDDWPEVVRAVRSGEAVLMVRLHPGFFISMGVFGWEGFTRAMELTIDDPPLVEGIMRIQAEFTIGLADRLLREVPIDGAVFSEPIGGNDGPLISPQMYERYCLKTYRPVMDHLARRGVEIFIFRTYANARLLLPKVVDYGFNCLWACEVNLEAMDYREIRREFGRDLRLIGGVDLDVLYRGKEAIETEIREKVPGLVADGGYAPLADGRVRPEVPFDHYAHYRRLLEKAARGEGEPL
jgi:hypothetical protein